MVKRLILIRHGEAESNKNKFFAGQMNSKLTELGKIQAKDLQKRLTYERIDAIFCSDSDRARNTLKLSGVRGKKIYTKKLREKDYGDLEGVVWANNPIYYKFHFDPYLKAPNGESAFDVQKRVVDYYNEKIIPSDANNVLIVAHHGPIVLLSEHLLGIGLRDWRSLRMGNAGISIFEKEGKTFRLTLWNSLSHFGMKSNHKFIYEE